MNSLLNVDLLPSAILTPIISNKTAGPLIEEITGIHGPYRLSGGGTAEKNGLKTGLPHIFGRHQKEKSILSRMFFGNIAENLEICGRIFQHCENQHVQHVWPLAMAQEFQEPAFLSFVSTEHHRTNSLNPWHPDFAENEAVCAAIWQNHLSHFLFSIAFF